MHQQVKTSPHDARGNLTAVVEALAGQSINIEAIAPDFEWPHIRTVVEHGQEGAAMEALQQAGLEPILLKAVAFDLENTHGQLDGVLKQLRNRGYEIESLLVGGTHGRATASACRSASRNRLMSAGRLRRRRWPRTSSPRSDPKPHA